MKKTPSYQIKERTSKTQEIKNALCKNVLTFNNLKPKTENQKKFIETIYDTKKEIVLAGGLAGCGKTYISLMAAINLLKQSNNNYTEINIFKSITPLEGENIGYLPGNEKEKLKFVMESYYMQLRKEYNEKEIKYLMDNEYIKIFPLANIRGMSIGPNTITIVDEFQNISIRNSKTILTRLEAGGKFIAIGDKTQYDRRDYYDNGLEFVMEKLINLDDKIEVIEFNEDDVVRNELIKKIAKVYEANNY